MKFKAEEFRGTGQVFCFTLMQFFKSKSNVVMLIILLVMSLASVPIFSLTNGGTIKSEGSRLTKIYYENDTDTACSLEELLPSADDSAFASVPVEKKSVTFEDLKENEAMVHLYQKDGMYQIDVRTQPEGSQADHLLGVVTDLFQNVRYQEAGVSKEQIQTLQSGIQMDVSTMSSYKDSQEVGFETAFAVQYGYSILVLILVMYSTSYIIRSVIEEKASKLVDTLMVSIRPLAMIAGKILAVMAYVFGILLVMLGGMLVSWLVSSQFMDTSAATGIVNQLEVSSIHLTPMTILVVLISLILGYAWFSLLGGLAGTSCSSMEDAEGANMVVVLLVMAGYLIATIATGFGSKTLGTVLSLIPPVSVFCAPAQFVCGTISLPILLLSWLIQIVIIWFTAVFCARIYHGLLLYNGTRMKLSDLIALFRSSGMEKKERNHRKGETR